MLPDYPELKIKIREKLMEDMQSQMNAELGIVGKIPKSFIFEGDRFLIVREDGSVQETVIAAITSNMNFTKEELAKAGPEEVIAKLKTAAEDLANQQSKMTFDTIDEEVSKIGNKIDAKGKSPVEAYLEGLEKMQIDFDPHTKIARLPQMITSPENIKNFEEDLKKLETDVEYKRRFEKILEKKKEEWNVREGNRKLVR